MTRSGGDQPVRRRDALLVGALPVAFYHPLLNLTAMQSGGDAANLFWPIKFLLAGSLFGQGIVPLWNPWSFLGTPLLASMQHAVLYPPDWLLYSLLPAHWALNLGNLLHLALAAVGAWLWLRVALGCDRWSSILLGGAFPCISLFWGHQEHINQIAAAAYLPGLTAIAWLFMSGRLGVRAFAILYGVGSSLQFLSGHPQNAFYGHLLVLALGIAWLARQESNRMAWLGRTASGAVLSAFLAGLLVAIQLLPTLELNKHSRRQFRDPLYAISFSMPPDMLLTHLWPHREGNFRDGYFLRGPDGAPILDQGGNPSWNRRAFGEYGVYVGLPILILAALGLGLHRRRRLALLMAAVYTAAVLLALGGNTDPRRLLALDFTEFPQPGYSLHELFLRLFPVAQGFRVPARILLIGNLAIVTLACLGLDALMRRAGPRHGLLTIGVGLSIFLALYTPSRKEKYHFPATVEEPLLVLRSISRDGAPGTHGSLDDRVFRLTMSDDDSLIRERHLDTTFGRGNPIAFRATTAQPHLNVPAAIPLIDGYEEGLVPTARYKDFQHAFNRNFRQFQPDAELLALLGAGTIFTELPVDPAAFPPRSDSAFPAGAVHRNPLAKGAAFLSEGTEDIRFYRLDGPFWQGGEPLAGFSREAVVFGSLNREVWLATPRLVTRLPNVNRIDVGFAAKLPANPEAIMSLGWFPGWVILREDGRDQQLEFLSAVHAALPADAMSSMDVNGGWRLAYRPFSFRAGLFLTALGFLTLGFLIGSRRRGALPLAPDHAKS